MSSGKQTRKKRGSAPQRQSIQSNSPQSRPLDHDSSDSLAHRALPDSPALTSRDVLHLQRAVGNKATNRYLAKTRANQSPHNTIHKLQGSQNLLQRLSIALVPKDNADMKGRVSAVLGSWKELAVERLPKQPRRGEAYKGRDYVSAEIASMLNSFKAKWGAKDEYVVADHEGKILAVMKFQRLREHIQLNHIIAEPRAKGEAWPGGESPVSALMAWVAKLSTGNDKRTELNAEELSLIPLYRHYGYAMKVEALEKEIKTFESTELKGKSMEEQTGLWEGKIGELEKRGVKLPEMVKR